ncbi:hypothetical protein [Scytonema millei]|uniref:Uncharacterized protein n=1 Tax=Scytonema millei VB511283 TaxID=1245923 RepID=A0A9X5E8U3_9CYAN|nr:hypothetical protein [Scytonema millei]NHC37299.1 hypothetical protein [Scytonema millei VB511283]
MSRKTSEIGKPLPVSIFSLLSNNQQLATDRQSPTTNYQLYLSGETLSWLSASRLTHSRFSAVICY